MTKTAAIVLCEEKVLIWAIPRLLPQSPHFHNPTIPWNPSPTYIPPLFTLHIPFPDDIDRRLVEWKTMSPWYSDSSNPLRFHMISEGYIVHKFQITLGLDLSSATVQFVNALKPPHTP